MLSVMFFDMCALFVCGLVVLLILLFVNRFINGG